MATFLVVDRNIDILLTMENEQYIAQDNLMLLTKPRSFNDAVNKAYDLGNNK